MISIPRRMNTLWNEDHRQQKAVGVGVKAVCEVNMIRQGAKQGDEEKNRIGSLIDL